MENCILFNKPDECLECINGFGIKLVDDKIQC